MIDLFKEHAHSYYFLNRMPFGFGAHANPDVGASRSRKMLVACSCLAEIGLAQGLAKESNFLQNYSTPVSLMLYI
jgi:hypothetical protein